MTVDEFVDLLDERSDRELIRGQVREGARHPHSRAHSATAASLAHSLKPWEVAQPRPRPTVLGSGAGFLLRRGPDTLIGADVSIASASQVISTPRDRFYFEGPPVLAIEILEPWDTMDEFAERIKEFLSAGATLWEVDPDFRIVRVHRPDRPVESFNTAQELVGDLELPGFRVAVAAIFED
jgi:Uma2 family endonuclease